MGVKFAHGLTGWVKYKCKCGVCRAAKNAAQARYRAKEPPASRARQNQANKRYRDRLAAKKNHPAVRGSEAALLPSDWSY